LRFVIPSKTARTIRTRSILGFLFISFILYEIAMGWGSTGHRYINRRGVMHLPASMPEFISLQSFFEAHAMDADARKGVDTSESPKHFLDIDYYPNFRFMTRDLDSLIGQYGWTIVRQNGIVPWATVWALDSLAAQLARRDWGPAYLTASDLGHYVADAHQPLHCTVNYNGQLTGNYGIHSRYESTMITNFQGELTVTADSVRYVDDPINFIFDYIIHAQSFVDSVMQADNYAKAMSGWNGSGTPPSSYYSFLWSRSRVYTIDQIQRATVALASLWYTAHVDAGLISVTAMEGPQGIIPSTIHLRQNFPNPFNPETRISYTLASTQNISLTVYDVSGRLVAVLADGIESAGEHVVDFNPRHLSSGIYFYRLRVGLRAETRKMLFMK
jgi:hypothetical protein